jgi:hypothetical protein
MDMGEAIQEAYAYADHDVTIWETLELRHSSWLEADYIRLVDSPVMLVTAQGTYQPVTMKAILPETESSVRGQLQVDIDFLPIAYSRMIFEASQEADPVYLYYRQYMGEGESAEPELELPVALTVNAFEFTDQRMTITALYPDLVNIILGRRIMTTSVLPGGRT